MNIFVLSSNPTEAAIYQCDKHIPKMAVETAQMLCTVHHMKGADYDIPYKPTHSRHGCTIWAGASLGNYVWLVEHGLALVEEYLRRFAKGHRSSAVLDWSRDNLPRFEEETLQALTPFYLAMPDKYKVQCPVQSYRNYYIGDKIRFARWNKTRPCPYWWPDWLMEN